jgi:hypothetical protein
MMSGVDPSARPCEVLLLILQIHVRGRADRPAFGEPRGADAGARTIADGVAHRDDEQVHLTRMGALARGNRVQPRQSLSQRLDELGRRDLEGRVFLEHVQHVVRLVPPVEVVLQLFGVALLHERREIRRTAPDQQLEQPPARREQVVDLRQRAMERQCRAVRDLYGFVAGGANRADDALDERGIVRGEHTQRVARLIGRRRTLDRNSKCRVFL